MNKTELIARYLRVCGTEAAVRMIVSKLLMKVADENELLEAIEAQERLNSISYEEDEEE